MSLPWAWLQTNVFPHYFATAILLDKSICRWTKQFVVLLFFSTEIQSSDGYGAVYLPRKKNNLPNRVSQKNICQIICRDYIKK
jgi:hypothetical protein